MRLIWDFGDVRGEGGNKNCIFFNGNDKNDHVIIVIFDVCIP